jgi:membrane protease YdiL (CAAX protease family)
VNKRRFSYILLLVLAGCLAMAWVEIVISPGYAVKSAIKLVLFLLLPMGYSLIDRQFSFRRLFSFDSKRMIYSVLLGVGVYLLIMGAYYLVRPYFNFSNITGALQNNVGVNKSNFLFVALYISFINSLLEEFFFRGFAFFTLKKATGRKVAYIFSAGAFSLYHIAVITSWFTPVLFALLIASLFVAGLLFNWLNEKSESIFSSWLVHMCANLAINTIGLMLFQI